MVLIRPAGHPGELLNARYLVLLQVERDPGQEGPPAWQLFALGTWGNVALLVDGLDQRTCELAMLELGRQLTRGASPHLIDMATLLDPPPTDQGPGPGHTIGV